MTYEEHKKRKLKRMPVLRIMNALGMVSWKDNGDGEAEQYLRLLHPLSWVWIVVMAIYAVAMAGFPETIEDLKYVMKNETVWF